MFFSAFTMGLLGSIHCIGMCGPLALSLPINKADRLRIVLNGFIYNSGRILSYVLLGAILGLLGWGAYLIGFQKQLSIFIGILMIIAAFKPLQFQDKIPRPVLELGNYLMALFAKSFRIAGPLSIFRLGLLNGFLPCGLVYTALAGSFLVGSLSSGIFFMFLFGLGTFPAMLGMTILGQNKPVFLLSLRRFYPYAIGLFGVFLIYRGYFFDIPLDVTLWEIVQSPIMCH